MTGPRLDPEQLPEHVRDTAPPPRRTRRYALAMVLAAATFLVLPALYLAFVASVGWATWWWIREAGEILPAPRVARGTAFALLRVGPAVVGGVVFLALLKPLLVRSRASSIEEDLDRDAEPLLHAYVEHLAALVDAPRPRRIHVDLAVNASASFHPGVASFLRGDMVLTLGLPLAGCLDLREFTSVVAHELGHFAQGAGMRSTLLVHLVRGWFARVVYQRDRFDDALERLARRSDHIVSMAVLNAARGGVWVARRVLEALMHAGDAVASGLSRQMEFDADAQAVRIAGSDAFASSMRTICLIDRAHGGALYDVNTALEEGRLGDDWVELLKANVRSMPAAVHDEVEAAAAGGRASMYATHPPTGQRIARARSYALESGVDVDVPARALFQDFEGLVRRSTVALYVHSLGERYRESMLVDSRLLNELVERELACQRIADEVLEGRWSGHVRLRLADVDVERGVVGLAARDAHEAAWPDYDARVDVLAEEDGRTRRRRMGRLLLAAGVPLDRRAFEVEDAADLPSAALDARLADAERFVAELDDHALLLCERLVAALAGLRDPGIRAGLADAERLDAGAAEGLEALRLLGDVAPLLHELWRAADVQERIARVTEGRTRDRRHAKALAEATREAREVHARLRAELDHHRYPFSHGEGPVAFGHALCGEPLTEATPAHAVNEACERATRRAAELQARALGLVLEAVVAVERALATPVSAAA